MYSCGLVAQDYMRECRKLADLIVMVYNEQDGVYFEEDIEEEGEGTCKLCGGDIEDGVCVDCNNAVSEDEESVEEEIEGGGDEY